MGLVDRAADLQNRFLDRLRHRDAFSVARQEGTAADFSSLRGARQCLLISFRRSGEPVPSPVNFGLSPQGLVYFRCEPESAKVKRMRRDPHVRVCACSFRGKPLGPVVEGEARVLDETESERAHDIVAANWDLLNRIYEGAVDRMDTPIAYVEVRPAKR
jgi:PPOX class probable F420-dependent enzyme